MTQSADPGGPATPEQEEELSDQAEAAGEEIPSGMRSAEAAQRTEELKIQQPEAG